MRQRAASYSKNGDAMGQPSWRSSFLGDADANFFCTGCNILEILPHPVLALRPKRVALRGDAGLRSDGVRELIHQRGWSQMKRSKGAKSS